MTSFAGPLAGFPTIEEDGEDTNEAEEAPAAVTRPKPTIAATTNPEAKTPDVEDPATEGKEEIEDEDDEEDGDYL